MRQKFAGMRVRKEKGNRDNNKEAYSGNRKRDGAQFPFKMRQAADCRKNIIKIR